MGSTWLDTVGLRNGDEFLRAPAARLNRVRLAVFGHVHQDYDANTKAFALSRRRRPAGSSCRAATNSRSTTRPPAYRRIELNSDGSSDTNSSGSTMTRLALSSCCSRLLAGRGRRRGVIRSRCGALQGVSNSVYLLGSIHLLREQDHPLPRRYRPRLLTMPTCSSWSSTWTISTAWRRSGVQSERRHCATALRCAT